MNTKDNNVIAGVDVGSQALVLRASIDSKVLRFGNDPKGIRELIQTLNNLSVTLVVCEHTGGYEWELLSALWERNIPVHCAQPRATANFAKALKLNGKSDPLDAGMLMEYGLRMKLELTVPPLAELTALKELTARRSDLNDMLVQETNRFKAPATSAALKKSINAHLRYLRNALDSNAADIAKLVQESPSLKAPIERLDEEHGVGFISAACVYGSMPELGTLTRQTAGALAGLAPRLRDSGKLSGYRKISGGRTQARSALYMVALTVIRKKGHVLSKFYKNLKSAGKKTNVAITAVMRKLIVRFNTILRELRTPKTNILPICS